jgi:hypothetical protein
MNYPAAGNGVSTGILFITLKGRELALYPPLEGLSAFGGLNCKNDWLCNIERKNFQC